MIVIKIIIQIIYIYFKNKMRNDSLDLEIIDQASTKELFSKKGKKEI